MNDELLQQAVANYLMKISMNDLIQLAGDTVYTALLEDTPEGQQEFITEHMEYEYELEGNASGVH